MAALVNGIKGINFRNGSRLVGAVRRGYYQLHKVVNGVTAGEGWTGLIYAGGNNFQVALVVFQSAAAFPFSGPRRSSEVPLQGCQKLLCSQSLIWAPLPVNASLQIYLSLLVLAAWWFLVKPQALNQTAWAPILDSLFPAICPGANYLSHFTSVSISYTEAVIRTIFRGMFGGLNELIQVNVLDQCLIYKVKNVNYYHVSFPTVYLGRELPERRPGSSP